MIQTGRNNVAFIVRSGIINVIFKVMPSADMRVSLKKKGALMIRNVSYMYSFISKDMPAFKPHLLHWFN